MVKRLIVYLLCVALAHATDYPFDGTLGGYYTASLSAVDGDTITCTVDTATWNAAGGNPSVAQGVVIRGKQPGGTTIHVGSNNPSPALFFQGDRASIKDFHFIMDVGGKTLFRITADGSHFTNITYDSVSGANYFMDFEGVTRALVESCTINTVDGSEEPVFARGPTNSWQTASTLGTANALYFENCTFTGAGYVCDINANGRAVFRFCTITGAQKIDGHGLTTNTPARSVRHMEIYGNNWTTTASNWIAIEVRGGTAMIFKNTAPSSGNIPRFFLSDYAYQGGPYANYSNVLQTPALYPLPDQIGVGIDPKAAASEPAYVWSNLQNGTTWTRTLHTATSAEATAYGSAFDDSDVIKPNRDFFADAGFSTSTGVQVGTKATMLASSPSVVGQGWWVTDEASWNTTLPANTSGQLYAWSGSAWVLKYTPYTYPHPLRSGIASTNHLSGAIRGLTGQTN